MLISNNVSDNDKYLDFGQLRYDMNYEKVAYVQDVREGVTTLNDGFFKFYLKDINGDMIVARLFGVKDFAEVSKKARGLKGKAVTIKFYTQEFNGSLSILLNEIDIYTGEVNYEKFIGKVDDLDRMIATLKDIDNIDLMANSRLTDFYNGKVGGFVLFAYLVREHIKAYTVTPLVNGDVLRSAYKDLMPLLFSYYRKKEVIPVIDQASIIMDASVTIITNSLQGASDVLTNAYLSVCDVCKPQYLESIILYDTIKSVLNTMNLIVLSSSMTQGSIKKLDSGNVLKKL